MKYIFVEGNDDNNFISEIVKGAEIMVIQYAGRKKSKIEGMINTFNKMNEEYIFLADLDEKTKEERISELKNKFANIDCRKIYFSIQEIEAWYIAGVSESNIEKYRIKKNLLNNTENITKEKFERLFKNKKETLLQIKLDILSEFNIEIAKSRNTSLKIFLEEAI